MHNFLLKYDLYTCILSYPKIQGNPPRGLFLQKNHLPRILGKGDFGYIFSVVLCFLSV